LGGILKVAIVICENCDAQYEIEEDQDPSFYCCAECGGSLLFLADLRIEKNPIYDEKPIVVGTSSFTEQTISKYNFYIIIGAVIALISLFAFYAGYILSVLFLIVGIFIIVYALNKRKSWEKGDKGEKIVADNLKNLSRSVTFNDVNLPNGMGNIDHVVVGENGVFAIETKNFTGSYMVRGNQWYFKQGRRSVKAKSNPGVQVLRNSMLLRDFLKEKGIENKNLWVYAIVSMVSGNVKIIKSPKHYFILKPSEINDHILKSRKRLDENSIYNISKLIAEFCSEMVFKPSDWPEEWTRDIN